MQQFIAKQILSPQSPKLAYDMLMRNFVIKYLLQARLQDNKLRKSAARVIIVLQHQVHNFHCAKPPKSREQGRAGRTLASGLISLSATINTRAAAGGCTSEPEICMLRSWSRLNERSAVSIIWSTCPHPPTHRSRLDGVCVRSRCSRGRRRRRQRLETNRSAQSVSRRQQQWVGMPLRASELICMCVAAHLSLSSKCTRRFWHPRHIFTPVPSKYLPRQSLVFGNNKFRYQHCRDCAWTGILG